MASTRVLLKAGVWKDIFFYFISELEIHKVYPVRGTMLKKSLFKNTLLASSDISDKIRAKERYLGQHPDFSKTGRQ